jgi:hypothetical protein
VSKLTVPNNIVDGTLVEASEHQQNYQQIESFVNNQVIHADGSVAMDAGSELLLGAAATVPQGAVTKAQLDNAVGSDVAGGGFLPLAGGKITGDLEVTGTSKVDGKAVSVDGHTHDQVYTKQEIDALLAARPLMQMCDKPTRIYDQRGGKKALTWHKIQFPATIGGVSRSGAKAAYVNMQSVTAAYDGWIAVRPDGSNWDPNSGSHPYSTLNTIAGETNNEHFLTRIGSNGAIQFWVSGSSTSDTAVEGLVVDVIALVF